ncbi:MAG: hypothetical protein JKY22_00195 [Flavobacteriaceae bacterium]|nr:hypothetical protein [Flavobacteriaceae bacterium]
MNYFLILFDFLFLACESDLSVDSNDVQIDLIQSFYQDFKVPKCPKNHTDSIIPIAYGYPGEELRAKADSGLVVLGGCELGEANYFCKIHKISF